MVTRHIAAGDLPPGTPEPSAEDLKTFPPTGGVIATIVAGGLGGAALGEGLYRTSPPLAWLACLGACLTLYAVATIAGRHGPRRSNLLVILGLGFCVFVSTIFIWAASLPRATSGLTLTRNLFFVLSILVLGAVTPVAIVLTALRDHWRWPRGAMRPPRPSVAPLLISAGLATAGIVIGLAAVFGTFLVVRTSDVFLQIAALAVSGAAMPILLWPVWVTVYEWLVARWQVEPPDVLTTTLETLGDHVGFTFTRVVCLAPSYGRGRVCQIVHRPGRAVLIVSRPLAESLPAQQLLAVIAHEAAHVHLRHTARRVLWGTLSAAIAIGGSIALGAAVGAILPKALAFTRVTAAVLSMTLARLFWDHAVVRRHEREADEFAVRIAGSAAMLGALQRLGGRRTAVGHRASTVDDPRHARGATSSHPSDGRAVSVTTRGDATSPAISDAPPCAEALRGARSSPFLRSSALRLPLRAPRASLRGV